MLIENFFNLVKKKYTQVQEAWIVPYNLDPKNSTPRHIIIKMTSIKDKDGILKAAREK